MEFSLRERFCCGGPSGPTAAGVSEISKHDVEDDEMGSVVVESSGFVTGVVG